MNGADTLGWSAAALMVATFSCRDPSWMRPFAVCTNVAFIAYASSAGLAPVLALHALLLPINLLRWIQSVRAPTHRHLGRDGPSAQARPAGHAGARQRAGGGPRCTAMDDADARPPSP